jgi:orotate phosphoribosyltransferase
MDDETAIGHLRMWLRTRAIIRRSGIKLASGGESDYYIDGRKVALWPNSLRAIGSLLYNRALRYRPTAIGGPATAAIPLVAAMLLEAERREHDLEGFYVRTDVKDHGLQKLIEGKDLTADDAVVLVEDVVTKGETLLRAARAVRATGARILAVICIVDREAGAADLDWGGATFERLFTRTDLEL